MPSGSSPLTGSSSTMISGFGSNAIPIPRRCFIPSENLPAHFLPVSLSPTRFSISSMRFSSGYPLKKRTYSRFSRAVIEPEMIGCSIIKLILAREASRFSGLPNNSSSPFEGKKKPANIFMIVVLPAPFGPISPQICPRSTVKLKSCRTSCFL